MPDLTPTEARARPATAPAVGHEMPDLTPTVVRLPPAPALALGISPTVLQLTDSPAEAKANPVCLPVAAPTDPSASQSTLQPVVLPAQSTAAIHCSTSGATIPAGAQHAFQPVPGNGSTGVPPSNAPVLWSVHVPLHDGSPSSVPVGNGSWLWWCWQKVPCCEACSNHLTHTKSKGRKANCGSKI